jgi:hypothetical protein
MSVCNGLLVHRTMTSCAPSSLRVYPVFKSPTSHMTSNNLLTSKGPAPGLPTHIKEHCRTVS